MREYLISYIYLSAEGQPLIDSAIFSSEQRMTSRLLESATNDIIKRTGTPRVTILTCVKLEKEPMAQKSATNTAIEAELAEQRDAMPQSNEEAKPSPNPDVMKAGTDIWKQAQPRQQLTNGFYPFWAEWMNPHQKGGIGVDTYYICGCASPSVH